MKTNMILEAKIRNLKQLGKQNTKHKPTITTTDLDIFISKNVVLHKLINLKY